MSTGRWSEENKPVIPGYYSRFKTAAQETIKNGTSGTLALTVKANWGPIKEPFLINEDAENILKQTFGDDPTYSAYKLGKLALLGNTKELILYRLADYMKVQSSFIT